MRHLAILFSMLLLTACATGEINPVTQIVRVFVTATPGPTATSSRTPTSTQTPSPTLTPTSTPTPTPTAVTALISGNPRAYQLLDPTPSYGAPCGMVDTFDFPLDPPHGENMSGGGDFGRYRSRYDKYHAGEDLGLRNISNFGQPVYAIGHGEVTYAAPNGWGLDRGTVVIRHTFPWGGYVLSFYGHLDPPSVTIKAGGCVERGDKIGEIGRPRTPPHLHFEIRLHLPISAGPGYWSIHPALAGWLPPSQTIWETRMAAAPGVLWTETFTEGPVLNVGVHQDNLIIIKDSEMRAIKPGDGTIQWSQPISETIKNVAMDVSISQVYQLDFGGDLTAYPLPGPSQPAWKAKLDALSLAELIPFPNGGILVADRHKAIAVSPGGEVRWHVATNATPISWVQFDNIIIFATSDEAFPLWSASLQEVSTWDVKISGKLAVSSSVVYLYAEDGLYRLNVEDQTETLVMQLPTGLARLRDLVPGPDGGLLLIHADGYDRRLLSIHRDGSLNWERSVKSLPYGDWKLLSHGDSVYLLVSHSDTGGIKVDVYAIDLESSTLTHIIAGGSRQSYALNTWLTLMDDDLLLLNIGGGPMAAFDPQKALDVISPP